MMQSDGYDFPMEDFILLGIISLNCILREGINQAIQDLQLS